jgi:hypothetical protein
VTRLIRRPARRRFAPSAYRGPAAGLPARPAVSLPPAPRRSESVWGCDGLQVEGPIRSHPGILPRRLKQGTVRLRLAVMYVK